ncbi:MAG: accessory factor UbiK family protein [Kiloniellales bacterium]
MQSDNRLLDDLARLASGALGVATGMRQEFEARFRETVERWLAGLDLVPREEFEVVRALAMKARDEQERLSAQVAMLERRLAALEGKSAGAQRPRRGGPGKD